MPLSRVIPALADLTQDIAGPLPLSLLQSWASGTQTRETALKLLEEFRIAGSVVATDTSGLSLLTQEKELLDVLTLISVPKEIVHAVGTGIGGRAIGIWVADNTEMFYPTHIGTSLLLDALSEAMQRISRATTIGLGFCAHAGTFYEIGGGLYGSDAEAVEGLAEQYARPGEILVTAPLADRLDDRRGVTFSSRRDLDEVYPPGVFTMHSDRRLKNLDATNTRYPHPFPEDFFELFRQLPSAADCEELKRRIYERYVRERTVVFLAREQLRGGSDSLSAMLDDLVLNALTDTIVRETLQGLDHISSAGGGLAILTFDTTREALDFAYSARARFAQNGVQVRVGIDAGPVLLFENVRGRSGITGDPVNLASKLSEDVGEAGVIQITDRAARTLGKLEGAVPFDYTLSNVRVTGWTA